MTTEDAPMGIARLVDVVHEALTHRGFSDAEATQIVSRIARHGEAAGAGCSVMPFGRYQGTPITDIPTRYLAWVIAQPWFRVKYRALYADILDVIGCGNE